jgi:hypothetical protein
MIIAAAESEEERADILRRWPYQDSEPGYLDSYRCR